MSIYVRLDNFRPNYPFDGSFLPIKDAVLIVFSNVKRVRCAEAQINVHNLDGGSNSFSLTELKPVEFDQECTGFKFEGPDIFRGQEISFSYTLFY